MASASLLSTFWLLVSFAVLVASLLHINVKRLPRLFNDFVVYGKLRDKHRKWTLVQLLEVPKKCVQYFLVLSLTTLASSLEVLYSYQFLI